MTCLHGTLLRAGTQRAAMIVTLWRYNENGGNGKEKMATIRCLVKVRTDVRQGQNRGIPPPQSHGLRCEGADTAPQLPTVAGVPWSGQRRRRTKRQRRQRCCAEGGST